MAEPWTEYPDVWKTEAAFFSWLRGALRRAVWEKYPPKLIFKNENCHPPPDGYTGRAKSGNYCALSDDWEGKSKLEVDHIIGNAQFKSWDDLLPFVEHLCARGKKRGQEFQLVTKEAHKIKSYAERQGIPYEEAVIAKEVISICKGDDKQWLTERGVVPASNLEKRKVQIREVLMDVSNS